MGLNKDKEPSQSQLSLFDYKLPRADFSEMPTSLTAKLKSEIPQIRVPYREPEANKTPRFVSLSAVCHGLAIAAVTFLMIPPQQDLKIEPITIEIEGFAEAPAMGAEVEATKGSSGAAASMDDLVNEAVASTKAIEPMKAPEPMTVVAPKAAPVVAATKAAPPKPTAAAKTAVPVAAVAPTVDDIEAPELEAASATAPTSEDMADELDSDFNKIEETHNAALENEKAALAALEKEAAEKKAQDLAAVEKAQKVEKERVAKEQEKLRAKNSAAIAAAKKAEDEAQKIAADKAALLAQQQLAQQQEQENEQAAAQALAAAAGTGKGDAEESFGDAVGAGQGNDGVDKPAAEVAGAPQGLRSLDQLKQMPGNPRPQYDRIERRRGDQGNVAFAAYINKEGYPSQFRMLQSTGFRNLDGKTLAALKKWRFYPGQEGWVEMPFRWDLKGGVQEDGGLLRRSAQGY